MARTLYLGGGGSAADEAALWRAMLPSTRRVLHWPVALPPAERPSAADWLSSSLHELGLRAQVDTWTELDGHRSEELGGTDLLFVGGGNTFDLLEQVRRAGLVGAVRDFVADGGDYYGGSAGAVLACGSVEIARGLDPDDAGLEDLTGLGLAAGFTVLPHYTRAQSGHARAWSGRHRTTVLGVPERAGLVVRPDGRVRVVGTAAVWEHGTGGATPRRPGEEWCPR